MTIQPTPLERANKSGFPLQMKVESLFRADERLQAKGWRLIGSEVPWEDGEGSEFADLVVSRDNRVSYVLECKRWPGELLFLREGEPNTLSTPLSMCWGVAERGPRLSVRKLISWQDVGVTPPTRVTSVCVPLRTPDRNSLIESDLRLLLRTAGALAVQDAVARQQHQSTAPPNPWYYVPVLVTSAKLRVVYLKPEQISLEDGTISPTAEIIEDVDAIRFAKPLAHSPMRARELDDLSLASRTIQRRRTILIVSARHLVKTFECLEADPPAPWFLKHA